ncbi:hypothetical protein L1987_04335 [Smallanthus sonchifolius]|uniref:Uncharacterized protein n=1 Tax=Smallanthus sonchifolius TaxID=185202 RepID=A0ACB9KD81_9ASTR|nr:hypothetical protein L1987_04335 [Smallanthus sonchifolius]
MTEIVSRLEGALYIQENADAKAVVKGAGILNVKGLKTMDAQSENPFNASNHYLVLYINHYDPLQNKKTTAKYNEVNAEFTLYVKDVDTQSLSIVVNAIVSVEKHRQLGAATFKLTDLTPGMPLTFTLPGYFKVEVLYKPTNIEDPLASVQKAPIWTPKDGGLLIIIIHGAYLLSEKNDAHSSVSLFFHGEIRKTQGSLGSVDISLADVVNEKWTNQLYKLERGYDIVNHLQVELQWRTSD